jgi:hypothetical protein
MQNYETDVIAWANEQASLIRAGRFEMLDLEHIADEIEDVGKSEQRELESRMAVLLAHLIKWQYQPDRRGSSWRHTISEQRKRVLQRIQKIPSLKTDLNNPDWWSGVWADALDITTRETGFLYERFPLECPWEYSQITDIDFWPE